MNFGNYFAFGLGFGGAISHIFTESWAVALHLGLGLNFFTGFTESCGLFFELQRCFELELEVGMLVHRTLLEVLSWFA